MRSSVVTLLSSSGHFATVKGRDGWTFCAYLDATVLHDTVNQVLLFTATAFGNWEQGPNGQTPPTLPDVSPPTGPPSFSATYTQQHVSNGLDAFCVGATLLRSRMKDIAGDLLRYAQAREMQFDLMPWVELQRRD